MTFACAVICVYTYAFDLGLLPHALSSVRHLEGSAGIAGFLKSVHMLEKKQVPANLHFQSLNPHIDLEDFQAFPAQVFPGTIGCFVVRAPLIRP